MQRKVQETLRKEGNKPPGSSKETLRKFIKSFLRVSGQFPEGFFQFPEGFLRVSWGFLGSFLRCLPTLRKVPNTVQTIQVKLWCGETFRKIKETFRKYKTNPQEIWKKPSGSATETLRKSLRNPQEVWKKPSGNNKKKPFGILGETLRKIQETLRKSLQRKLQESWKQIFRNGKETLRKPFQNDHQDSTRNRNPKGW